MKGYFITGTDTGVGKTMVSAALLYILKGCYWKPIQTGIADESTDIETVRMLTGLSEQYFSPSVYCLQASLSPYHAAQHENRSIDLVQCNLPSNREPLLIEGAGGVFTPINEQETMLDWIAQFKLPVIIVSRGTLVTINH